MSPQQISQPPSVEGVHPTETLQSTGVVSVFDQAPLISATLVGKFNNITIFNMSTCYLEWTTANRIRLIRLDNSTLQPIDVEFDIDPSQITKIVSNVYLLTIYINGKGVQLDFGMPGGSGNIALATGLFGSLGGNIALANRADQASNNGLLWWIQALSSAAPQAKIKEIGTTLMWAGFGISAVIVLIALIYTIICTR